MSPEKFSLMLEKQGGVCAICGIAPETGKKGTTWNIDHDHVTGQVRGILCAQCNVGLGNLKDDVGVVRAALNYLEKNT